MILALVKTLAKFTNKPQPPVEVPTIETIAAGQTWYLRPDDDGDPFPHKTDNAPVEILDVKKGWVRYLMGRIFNDERMELRMFIRIYGPVKITD